MILSDSTSADAWIRETLCVVDCAARCCVMPVWYRRRWQNIARKAGNLEDFVTRWGGRYDHMIVLDADSLIEAPALKTLVQAMRADPSWVFCRPRRNSSVRRLCSAGCSNSRPAFTVRSSPAGLPPGQAIAATIGDTTPSFASRRSHSTADCPGSRVANPSVVSCCRMISWRPPSCGAAAGKCAWPPIAAAHGKNPHPR